MPNGLKIVVFLVCVSFISMLYGFVSDVSDYSLFDVLYMLLFAFLIAGLIKKSETARQILLFLTWVFSFFCIVILVMLFIPEKGMLKALSGTERIVGAAILICFSIMYTIINKYMRAEEILTYFKQDRPNKSL